MRYTLIFLGLILSTSNIFCLPKYGVSSLTSPRGDYELRLVDTSDPGTYELQILRHGVAYAHYPFSGELVTAYWIPSQKFVAINNHYGHGGTYVWVISLAEGSVITSHGAVKSSDYDRYMDYQDFPNLVEQAHSKLKSTYAEVDNDQLRNGYSSVAYGWRGDDQLLMFHEFGFDNLSTQQNLIIQAFTTWKVDGRGISLKSIRFRKARDDQYEPMPTEVKKTLNFIP